MGTTLIPPFATTNAQSDRAMAALAQANRVRLRRAALMRWLHGSSNADSHQKAAELVLGPDPSRAVDACAGAPRARPPSRTETSGANARTR